MELVDFLRARLDEDESAARAASEPEAWMELNRDPRPNWYVQYWADPDVAAVVADPESSAYPVVATPVGMAEGDAEGRVQHIARHDPARVLRRVKAERRIVDDYARTCQIRDDAADRIKAAGDHPDPAAFDTWDRAESEATILRSSVEALAAIYADHADYQQDWKP